MEELQRLKSRVSKSLGDERKRVVETLLLRLRRRVKYTGLELGEAAVLPRRMCLFFLSFFMKK